MQLKGTQKEKFQPFTKHSIQQAPQWALLTVEQKHEIEVVSSVFPFRANAYVLDHLIDWDRVPDDPIYRLTFPHKDMLPDEDFTKLSSLIRSGAAKSEIDRLIYQIRMRMNPHPAGQLTHNVPALDGIPLRGLQRKYSETVLFFPSSGQTCHAYCTFCFRWPQFVGMDELKFSSRTSAELVSYLRTHTDVTDVLITGGDPLVMNTRSLAKYVEPLLAPELAHVQNIRIGTKSVAYWPQRFVTDDDADDLLRLFEKIVAAGRNVAVMGHYSHPRELHIPIAEQAVRRIVSAGATLRIQAPLIRHVNDNSSDWVKLWTLGVRLGAIPYYMFVERDTGPSEYFRLPLIRAYEIFRAAYSSVSGLARTVRGPSMSAFPGKVLIDGVADLNGEKVFALQFLQARDANWVRRPFYAQFDPEAVWFDQLRPAFGENKFFFEREGQEANRGFASNENVLADSESQLVVP